MGFGLRRHHLGRPARLVGQLNVDRLDAFDADERALLARALPLLERLVGEGQ
jgi:hypothetical protein